MRLRLRGSRSKRAARAGVSASSSTPSSTPSSIVDEPLATLTKRELEVLELLSRGYSNKETAALLFLSSETVKSHVRQILAKLRARNRTHAVSIAHRLGLL